MRLTEPELVRWGERLGQGIEAPAYILLSGPLGAGKSVLARAIARGMGVRDNLPSPTFNLMFRYEAERGLEVVHMDLYRINEPDELFELGWDELGAPDEVVLVEWPERAGEDRLPADHWTVSLEPVEGEPKLREISVGRAGHPPFLPGFPVRVER